MITFTIFNLKDLDYDFVLFYVDDNSFMNNQDKNEAKKEEKKTKKSKRKTKERRRWRWYI